MIFIVLLLFAPLIFNTIVDKVKLALMFIFSFAIAIYGVIRTKKEESAFNLAVLACGVGAIFISLFVGHIYFKLITLSVLFMALIACLAITFYLSRHSSILFKIIGETGLLIYVIFAMFLDMDDKTILIQQLMFYYMIILRLY